MARSASQVIRDDYGIDKEFDDSPELEHMRRKAINKLPTHDDDEGILYED